MIQQFRVVARGESRPAPNLNRHKKRNARKGIDRGSRARRIDHDPNDPKRSRIGHLRQTGPSVTLRLGQYPASGIVLCSVVLAELLYGAERSGPAHRATNFALVARLRSQYVSLPFEDLAAEEVRPNSCSSRQPGHTNRTQRSADCSHCPCQQNHPRFPQYRQFSRVLGLTLEDWQIP